MTLGVKVESYSKDEAIKMAEGFLHSDKQAKIYTVNPEMVVRAQKDEYFKQVLNAGDMNTCDGFGLWLALRLSFRPKRSEVEKSTTSIVRLPGVDFMIDICRLAAKQGRSVFLLGSGSDEVVKKTADNLKKQFPNLKIAGYDKGPMINESIVIPRHIRFAQCKLRRGIPLATNVKGSFDSASGLAQDDNEQQGHLANYLVNKVNNSNAEILFVAFGMGKQEKWIHENLTKMPNVRIAMGVGGSFDFISGIIPRAPLFLRRIGLEWMYRLIIQPNRLSRIFNATILFAFLVLRGFIISNFQFPISKQ